MKQKKLSRMISKMTPRELYAFVSATVLEIHRQSGIPTDDILSAIKSLITVMEGDNNEC